MKIERDVRLNFKDDMINSPNLNYIKLIQLKVFLYKLIQFNLSSPLNTHLKVKTIKIFCVLYCVIRIYFKKNKIINNYQ